MISPLRRDCKHLDVPYSFCICKQPHIAIAQPQGHFLSVYGAEMLIEALNEVLDEAFDGAGCERLVLDKILQSHELHYEQREYYKLRYRSRRFQDD